MSDPTDQPGRRIPHRESADRQLVWAGGEFDEARHSRLHRMYEVLAYNSINQKWGLYDLCTLRDIPHYLVPDRALSRRERLRGYVTMCVTKRRLVRLHFFARIEAGKLLTILNPG